MAVTAFSNTFLPSLLVILLIMMCCIIQTTSKVQKHRKLVIDHEVTLQQANEAARKILEQIDKVTPAPGCDRCTHAEIAYCMSKNALNDHCCCDRTHFVSSERFPWLEHTCYLTPNCHLVAADCEEFARVADCCCLRYNPTLYSALGSQACNISAPFNVFIYILSLLIMHLIQHFPEIWQ